MLKSVPGVSRVNALTQAIVPILEVVWNGIDLDVLLARLELTKVPELNMILDDKILKGLDSAAIRSINGPRVTEMLIKLVPNYKNFSLVLRSVRSWAKRRGIYSNKLGYLGGVNYAILVAFCCQLYPNAAPSKLLQRFFALYCEWEWPTEVRLCHSYERDYLQMKQWNPDDRADRNHVMPIITPAYPNQNSSYNVSLASLDVMLDEFNRAKDVCNEVLNDRSLGKVDIKAGNPWKKLFEESDFFTMFGSYIEIKAFVDDNLNPEMDLQAWVGFVESRLRKLCEGLQKFPLRKIYLYPKHFSLNAKDAVAWFIGLVRHPNKMANRKRLDLSYEIKAWTDNLLSLSKEKSLKSYSVKSRILKWSELPDDIELFPKGKEAYKTRRRVWINRRIAEQKLIRQNPNSTLPRYSYASFTPEEERVLNNDLIQRLFAKEAVVEDKTITSDFERIQQKRANTLLSKRLREEDLLKKRKLRGSKFNIINLPMLPGLDMTDMNTYLDNIKLNNIIEGKLE